MSFVSSTFIVFLVVAFALWQALPHQAAKRLLCLANFIFYGYWFPPFLLILWGFGLIDYWAARQIDRSQRRFRYLLLSISSNLGVLLYFKYSNFLLAIATDISHAFGAESLTPAHLSVILPIGISFYTFQSLSYVFDVYNRKITPCKSIVDYFFYLSFFPHLVAGPILRASYFLPQLHTRNPLTIEDWQFAAYRLSRGFFLKVVIADNISFFPDATFAKSSALLSGGEAWFGVFCFAIQIFCDFAGYSDIAIGTARLFGLRIPENFRNPYFAVGMEDFWRRWHISLSTWFRDYVYVPLGGNRISRLRTNVNIFIVFLVSGIWHGANWTFALWGALHGLAVGVEKALIGSASANQASFSLPRRLLPTLPTFMLVLTLWVPFRASSLEHTFSYWMAMFYPGSLGFVPPVKAVFVVALFSAYALLHFLKDEFHWEAVAGKSRLEAVLYFTAVLLMPGKSSDFIYFQF
jgi:alginate O-acetyltransferase complex protein AlgI